MVYFFVGIGGIVGSLLRYFLSLFIQHFFGNDFPFGTLIINMTGAFILGWVTQRLVVPKKLHPYVQTALTTGVIGSYTTFSTFCYETVHLLELKQYIFGFLYLFVSLIGGLFFIRLGMKAAINKKKGREVFNE